MHKIRRRCGGDKGEQKEGGGVFIAKLKNK